MKQFIFPSLPRSFRDWMHVLLFNVVLALVFVGCMGQAYDPTLATPTVAPGDKIQIISITAKPEHPVVPQACQVTIKVKNVSNKPLQNVEYVFDIASNNQEIGRGKIPSIPVGETVEIKSESAHFEQGIYRLEAKVFLPKGQDESKYEDRMNNVKAIQVQVTH